MRTSMTWTEYGLIVSAETIHSLLTEKMNISLDFRTDGVSSLSPDATLIAGREPDGIIRVRRFVQQEWRAGDVLFSCQLLSVAALLSFAWSPTGSLLAVQLADGVTYTYQIKTNRSRRNGLYCTVYRSDNPLPSREEMAIAPNEKWLALSTDPDGIVLVDQQTETRVEHFASASARSIAWSPNSRFIAVGGNDSSLTIFLARSGSAVQMWTGHAAPVSALSWSPDGATLLSGDQDGNLLVWNTSGQDPNTWDLLSTREPMDAAIEALAWSPDAGQFAALDSKDVVEIFPLS